MTAVKASTTAKLLITSGIATTPQGSAIISAVISDNSAVIGDNSPEIGDDAAGIVDITMEVTPC